jgi:hypothetical protein
MIYISQANLLTKVIGAKTAKRFAKKIGASGA